MCIHSSSNLAATEHAQSNTAVPETCGCSKCPASATVDICRSGRLQQKRQINLLALSTVEFDIDNTPAKISMKLNIEYFTDDGEIMVKVEGKELHVHCRHEHAAHHGPIITRQLDRSYSFTDDVDMSTIRSYLRDDGVLLIEAEKQRLS